MKRFATILLLLLFAASARSQVITRGNSGINAQTGTTYTIVLGDSVKLVTFSNAAAVAVTLPVASTFGAGVVFQVKNIGVGAVTITPTTSTIDGVATLVLYKNESFNIYNDGTNYSTHNGGSASNANPCAIDGMVYVSASGCYTTVAAAIASFGGSCGTVYIPAGTFFANINYTTTTCGTNGSLILQGAGRRNTFLKPSTNNPVITIDSTAGAVEGIQIRDIGFDNTGSGFTQPAISIIGTNINDFHNFRNLFMIGFKNSVNITGRTVWSVFDNIAILSDTDIAINIVGTASVNFNKFHMISVTSAAGAEGVLLSCTGSCGGQSLFIKNAFDMLDVENGTGAGIVLNNTEDTSITNGYFETNAGIQISATGTYGRGLTIRDNYINTPNNTVDISITATQITGEIAGNFIANSGGGASTISIAGSNASFSMFVHGNFEPNSGPHTNTVDGSGNYHATYYGAYPPVNFNGTGSQAPTVTGINNLRFTNASPTTITNFVGGDPGQTLWVFNDNVSTVTFTHVNTNGPFMPNQTSVTIGNGGFCQFVLQPNNGRWVGTCNTTTQTIGDVAPPSVSTTPGTAAPPVLSVLGVAGGATTNASGTGGVGSSPTIIAGVGGAASGATASTGGAGGAIGLAGGGGGTGAGTGANANGGSITLTPGAAGTGGSGAAGVRGSIVLAGPVQISGNTAIVADSGAINTTEAIVVKTAALPANRLLAGTTIRIVLDGTCTSTVANTSTFTIRWGTTGTTADGTVAAVVTSVAATSGTTNPFHTELILTVRTVGASATSDVTGELASQGNIGIVATPNAFFIAGTAFNATTASGILSVAYKSAATTTTSIFRNAFIEVVYQ